MSTFPHQHFFKTIKGEYTKNVMKIGTKSKKINQTSPPLLHWVIAHER